MKTLTHRFKAGKLLSLPFILCALSLLFSCNDDEENLPDENATTLNGKEFILKEFSASKSLNQMVVLAKNNRMMVRLVLFQTDTGEFIIKPNHPDMKMGEASAQLALDTKVYFAQSGTISIQKSAGNIYTGEFMFESVSLDKGWIELKNGKFKDVQATAINYGSVEDAEGNIYKTIKIGSQTWMAENLRSTKYSDGEAIPDIRAYNNNESLVSQYGLLYTWNAAMHGKTIEMSQGACPAGWHIPANNESNLLIESAGGSQKAGNNLKASVTWYDNYGYSSFSSMDDISNNNSTGFTAVAAGVFKISENYYDSFGFYGSFWNSTSKSEGFAGYTNFSYFSGNAFTYDLPEKNLAFPVRCIKNQEQ